jgi:acetyl-CoA carboxylase biotin carboxyl carrier protein
MTPEDINELKQLVEFLQENQVAEFEMEQGEQKIRLKFKQPEPPPVAPIAHVIAGAPQMIAAPAPLAAPVTQASAPAAPAPPADPDAGLHMIKSPIVGTYYGSPSPGAAPFVAPGDRVEKGQVVCIVEAMKLMNEIEADAAGEVVRCLVSNGQPIEFGQPLFAIRP